MGYLSPWEIIGYQNRLDSVRQNYQSQTAGTQYNREMLDLNNTRNVYDMAQGFDRQANSLPGSFVRRGLLNSGMAKRAWTDYGSNRLRAEDRQRENYTKQYNQYGAMDQTARDNYGTSWSGIETERAAQASERATYLDGNQG